ncbi:S4 domain-containing protein [Myxococcota bacterium]
MPDTSRATVQRWIVEGRVLVEGRPCRVRDLVRRGDTLEVEPASPPPSAAEPDPSVRFGVLYEDEYLLVVDKPAGLVVHPARGHAHGTLVQGLLARPGFALPVDAQDKGGGQSARDCAPHRQGYQWRIGCRQGGANA